MHCQELQLKSMLEQLRIKAKTVMVPWDHVLQQIEKTTSQTFTFVFIFFYSDLTLSTPQKS